MKLVIKEGPTVIDDKVVENQCFKKILYAPRQPHSQKLYIDEIVIPKSAKEIRWHDFASHVWPAELVCGVKITILGELETIGSKAFFGFPITKITLPQSLKFIGKEAFAYCQLLEQITIPDSVSSIGEGAFCNCIALQEVKLSNSLSSISKELFSSCWYLRKVTLPKELKKIGPWAFSFCNSLTSISLPDSLECIEDCAFSDTPIKNLYVPKNVKKISEDNAFSTSLSITIVVDKENKVFDSRDNCNAIILTKQNKLLYTTRNVYVPKTVDSISDCFDSASDSYESICVDPENKIFDSRDNCNAIIVTELNKLIVPSKKTVAIPESVESIDCIFCSFNCDKFVIPEGVKDIDLLFHNCHIGELVLPSTLENCEIRKDSKSSFKAIKVDPRNKKFDSRDNCNSLIDSKNNELLLASETTKIPSSVVSVNGNAFVTNSNEKKTVLVPEGVKYFSCHPGAKQRWIFVLPKSLRYFYEETDKDIFCYSGTYEEWKKNVICIPGSFKEKGIQNLRFYSEQKPKHGRQVFPYWHYVDGKPKKW